MGSKLLSNRKLGHNDKLHAAQIKSQSRFAFTRKNILIAIVTDATLTINPDYN
jgi:hypothetical protein